VGQSHPTTPRPHRGPCQRQLLTAAGAASSRAVGVGQVGTENPRTENTQLLLRGSCPLTCRSKHGEHKPAPLRDINHLCDSSPAFKNSWARFTLEHPFRTGCDFPPGLHMKLQIVFFTPFLRLLCFLASASNGHPYSLYHPSGALLPLPWLSLVPLTAFASISRNRDAVQTAFFLH